MLELCRSGYALRICLRSSRAHTMNAFIGLLMWLRAAAVVEPPPVVDVPVVVVGVVVGNAEVEDWSQTTSRPDLLAQRTMRADSIFSTHARYVIYKNMYFTKI